MIVEKEGVAYRLLNYGSEESSQRIVFTHLNEANYEPGTTNEEVISMLIDRIHVLNRIKPSLDNDTMLYHLKQVRTLLAKRMSNKAENKQRYAETHKYTR